ncbi:MAG: hypothetical protein IPH07_23050 [Deltaproteobacteria bacterium]|nr:hypothetical protein [Deltaproteobacteria bacterium]MBK8240855.1 hypothetical protein [Deltaproteobacteria bacterium]MBK8714142.1 hypothetical protein [Deltaproteobacteria bacterium]MBP7285604.1 hypothetical protein [Nannocystaceae bacterium]
MTRNTTTTASHPMRLVASLSLCLALPLGGCIKSLDLDDDGTDQTGGSDTDGGGTEGGGTGNVSTGASGGGGGVSGEATSAADGVSGEATSAADTEGDGTAEAVCPGFCVWENTCNGESDPQCFESCVENYDGYADLDPACNQAMHEWTACVSMVQGCDITECSVWAYALQTCEDTYSCAGGEGGGDGGAGGLGSCQWERSCGDGPVYAMSCADGTCSCTIDGEPAGECEQGATICSEDNIDGLEQAMNECCGFEG